MRMFDSLYDRIPAVVFLLALLAILTAAYLGDRADNARYMDECKQHLEPRDHLVCSLG